MAFRAFVGKDGGTTPVTTIQINVPTNVDGDLLIAVIAGRTASSAPTVSGWSSPITLFTGDSDAHFSFLYYRTAASEPASYTWTWPADSNRTCGFIASYSNSTWDVAAAAKREFVTTAFLQTGSYQSVTGAGPTVYADGRCYIYVGQWFSDAAWVGGVDAAYADNSAVPKTARGEAAVFDGSNYEQNLKLFDETLFGSPGEPQWDFTITWAAGATSKSVGGIEQLSNILVGDSENPNPPPPDPGGGGGGTTSGGDGGGRQGAYEVKTAVQHGKRRKVQIQVLPAQLNDQMLRE